MPRDRVLQRRRADFKSASVCDAYHLPMKARLLAAAVVIALVLSAMSAEKHPRISTLYDRIGAKMKANSALAEAVGKPSPELRRAAWLVGRWNVTARVFAEGAAPSESDHGQSTVAEILGGTWLEIRDSYDGQLQDLGFLTYNVATNEWIAIGVDQSGNAVTSKAKAWDGNRLALVAENAEILGERVVLRQTLEKHSDREYRILNEERLPSGEWAVIDEYVYRKQ